MDLSIRIVPYEARCDKMGAYMESVLTLSDVLLPFYDERMDTAYETYEKNFQEAKDKLRDDKGFIPLDNVWLRKMESVYRKLFRELNLLLNRNDYLKESVYGESKDETVEE